MRVLHSNRRAGILGGGARSGTNLPGVPASPTQRTTLARTEPRNARSPLSLVSVGWRDLWRHEPTTVWPVQEKATVWPRRARDAVLWHARRIVEATIDNVARLRDPMIPPRTLMFDGPQTRKDFKENGLQYLGYLVELGGLQPTSALLDVGSGMGRKAIPLTRYLSPEGRYYGFDITKSGVDWCTDHVTRRHPNFEFIHVDVQNPHYNPAGGLSAEEFRFPYPDAFFDVVLLGSVFTHMFSSEVDHYLSEIARVLKSTGRAMVTYFLLNSEAKEHIATGRSELSFRFGADSCRIEDQTDPLAAVAYEEVFMRGLYNRHGLTIIDPVHYGSWCGRLSETFQDIVIGRRSQ